MGELPVFVLSAIPRESTVFPNFFAKSGPSRLLENPGELRYAGWDMNTGDQVRIVRAEFLETGNPDWKLLQLYEDGTLIARVPADDKFLAWASTEGRPFWQHPRLNPLALIEFIYAFTELYGRMLGQLRPEPHQARWRADFTSMFGGDSRVFLSPFGVDSLEWQLERKRFNSPDAKMQLEGDVSAVKFRARPERVAYEIVERIYAWFGAASDVIPYVTGPEDERVIDVEKIMNAGKRT